MSLLMSFTRGEAVLVPLFPNWLIDPASAAAAAWPGANQGIFIPFTVSERQTRSGLRIVNAVPSTGQNAKSGVFQSDGTNLVQLALSASTELVGSTAAQDLLWTAAQTFVPGKEYAAFLSLNNVTATIYRETYGSGVVAAGMGVSYVQTNVFTTPPTSLAIATLIAAGAAASGYTPVVALV